MPVAARPCPTAGCYKLKPCPTHVRIPWGNRRQPGGTGWAWQRIRQRIMERDGYTCQIRTQACTITASEVDHIIGIARGGTDDDHNLRAACKPCHKTKTIGEQHG